MGEMGFSFMPGGEDALRDINLRAGDGALQSPQQAVQLLRLRVPKALPSNAPVARSLLAGPGSGGLHGLPPLLQALINAFHPQANLAGVQPVSSQTMTPAGPILPPSDASPGYDAVRSPTPPLPGFRFADQHPVDVGTPQSTAPPPTGAQVPGFFQRGPGKEFADVQG